MNRGSELYRGSRLRTAGDAEPSFSQYTEQLGGQNTQVPGQEERRSTTEFTGPRSRSPSVWARRKTFIGPKSAAEPLQGARPALGTSPLHQPSPADTDAQWEVEANRPPTPTALKFPFPPPLSVGRSYLQILSGTSRGSTRLDAHASRVKCGSRDGRGSGGTLGVRFSDSSASATVHAPGPQDEHHRDNNTSTSLLASSRPPQAARPSTSFTGALYSSEELDRVFQKIQADPEDASAGALVGDHMPTSALAGPSSAVKREVAVMGDEDLDERLAAMSRRIPANLFSVPFLQPIKGWDPKQEVHNNDNLIIGPTVAEYDWKGVHDSMNNYSFAEMLTLEDAMLLDLDSEAANREQGSLWMFNAERGNRLPDSDINNSHRYNSKYSACRTPSTAPPRCTSSLPSLPSYCTSEQSIEPARRTRRDSEGLLAGAPASSDSSSNAPRRWSLMRSVLSMSRRTLQASQLHVSPSVHPRAFNSSAAVASINAELHLERLQKCSGNRKALAAFTSSVEEVRYLRAYFEPPEATRKVAYHRIRGRHVRRADEPWLGVSWEAVVTRVVDGADSLVPELSDRPRQRVLLQKALGPQIKRLKFIFNHYQTIPTMGLAPSQAVVVAAMRAFFRMAQEADEDENSGPLHFDNYIDHDRGQVSRQGSKRDVLKATRRFEDIASKATKTRRLPEAPGPNPPAGREEDQPSTHARRGSLQRLSTTRRLQVKSYVEGAYGDKIRTADVVNFNESSRAHWTAVLVHAMDNPETGSMDQLWMCLRDCKVLSRELSISAINRAVYPPSEMAVQVPEGFAARWTAGLGGGTTSEIAKQRRNSVHRQTFAKKAKSFYIDKEDLDPVQLVSHNLKGAAGYMVAPLGHEELISKPEHLTGQIVLEAQEAKIMQLHRAFFDLDEDTAPPELDQECAAPKAAGTVHMRSRPIDLFFFTEALIRTAHLVVKDGTTVADRFHQFMEEKMRLACPKANTFMVAFLKPETLAVLKQYQAPLLKCFWFWAIERGASAMGLHRAGGVTMTYNDFLSMMTEMDFLNSNLDPKRLTKLFGHSVGHSELLSQIHPNNQDCEMMFDEFLECLTRCAVCLAGATHSRALHVELDDFIANQYLMKMANIYPSRL